MAGAAAFYEGEIARKIADGVQAAGGCMSVDDLEAHSADVCEPLSTEYRGYTVYETPPNSQGLILLEELNIVEGFDLAGMGHLSADSVHHMVEAKKLAFEDRARFAGDAAFVDFDPASMLSKEWAAQRRAEIDPQRARADAAVAATSDTTSFVVADGDGNVCSFIQSIFAHFGSAVAIDGTGIIMNNRMRGFSLDPASPNVLAPGKHTMHTLNTYLVFRDGAAGRVPYIVGNTPGADYQVQTNLQVLTGIIDYGLDPQAAVDAPRWGDTGGELQIERGMPSETAARARAPRPSRARDRPRDEPDRPRAVHRDRPGVRRDDRRQRHARRRRRGGLVTACWVLEVGRRRSEVRSVTSVIPIRRIHRLSLLVRT